MPSLIANGRTLFYDQVGQGDPLLFLSGLGGDHRAFSVPVRHFGQYFRSISMDNRDVGQSDPATGPYSTADMADDVAGFLTELNLDRLHVVGQSMGGLIAQELAIRHPNLVRSLVLVSTHAGADPWRKAVLDSWVMMRKHLNAADFTRATLPWLVAPPFYRVPGQVEGLIRFAERNATPQHPLAFERQAVASLSHDSRDRLARIQVPTLVLVGELDIVNPPRISAELAEKIPNATMTVLPNVGHLPHIEDNRGFRDALASFFGIAPGV